MAPKLERQSRRSAPVVSPNPTIETRANKKRRTGDGQHSDSLLVPIDSPTYDSPEVALQMKSVPERVGLLPHLRDLLTCKNLEAMSEVAAIEFALDSLYNHELDVATISKKLNELGLEESSTFSVKQMDDWSKSRQAPAWRNIMEIRQTIASTQEET